MNKQQRKVFVLDTNVLLLDPYCIFKFGKNDVHIPLICIEELDRFKKEQSENGRNARYFARIIDDLRKKGSLIKGVAIEAGGKIVISDDTAFKTNQTVGLTLDKNDNFILGHAIHLKKKTTKVVLITKDINLRLKSDVLGIESEDYNPAQAGDPNYKEAYQGFSDYEVESEKIEGFIEGKFIGLNEEEQYKLYPNQYLTLFNSTDKEIKVHGRFSPQEGGVTPLRVYKEGVWGIYPKNLEQRFALDALLNDEIKLVTLTGNAGTGKTLMAIAAALEKTINEKNYIRLLVSRPIQPLGKDLGFLPGDIEEKIAPWMSPIFDALDFLFGRQRNDKEGPAAWGSLKDKGLLQVEPLTYIRGRSIPNQYFIIDEAQNLSPHEIKTIITRVAEGSKIVLAGDCEQIDNPYLDTVNNGLTYAIEKMKNEKLVAHINLKSGERSELSELASKIL